MAGDAARAVALAEAGEIVGSEVPLPRGDDVQIGVFTVDGVVAVVVETVSPQLGAALGGVVVVAVVCGRGESRRPARTETERA
jgi:hypothetical protein